MHLVWGGKREREDVSDASCGGSCTVLFDQILQAKFDDFKHRVEAGSERFKQCDELAKKLIANESPYSSVIERKQEQLR